MNMTIPGTALFPWILDNISDIVTVLNGEGIVTYISPSVRRVLGYDPEELIGQVSAAIVHPDDIARLQAAFGALGEPGATRRAEYRCRHKDGSWRTLESVGVNYLEQAGAIIFSTRDITERRRAEEQLRGQLTTLQALYSG